MHDLKNAQREIARRHFLSRAGTGLGVAALASLASKPAVGASPSLLPQAAPRAKRVIYLFQSGAPSQIETFDHKPGLRSRQGSELPDSIRRGQRLTGMTSGQKSFPVASSRFDFARYGDSGTEISSLLPYTGGVADELCVVRSVFTEAINHDPAITLLQTGSQQPGRPSMGAWFSYGLGSVNEELPTFAVLISKTQAKPNPQGLLSRLWTNGFLPSQHQGVKLRAANDPVLYLSNPPGVSRDLRRDQLRALGELNVIQGARTGTREPLDRLDQYELAFKMQSSVPELVNLQDEPLSTRLLYGKDVEIPGSFAYNCLLARRLAERDVRFIQLYHRGWDTHGNLPREMSTLCRETDQPAAALITDLKQRGLLDDTLVVWSGEFGRTVYCQGKLTKDNYGRDHHPRCFSVWLAGAGIRGGLTYGETDDFSYNVLRDPVHVHDLQATILHAMGIDHERLTFEYQGRKHRLTDVHGDIVHDLFA
ncbi:MAG: DUF1501 domain-containing protein [Planctomycetota bacterium]